jgi:hypothetical protein
VLIALGRTADAVSAAERSIALLEPLVQSDSRNAEYSGDLATAWLWLVDARRARGEVGAALDLAQRTLDVRRRRAAHGSSSMLVPWGLVTNLNEVGELQMLASSANWREAEAVFTEARDLARKTLARAPAFTEMRKELAISYANLARTTMAHVGGETPEVRALLEQCRETWAEVAARSVGDHRHAPREEDARKLIGEF